MEPWYFVFNGVDSRSMGVRVNKYPPIMRAAERVKYVTIPGRAGDLTQKEGKAVYDAYNRGMEISNMRGFDLHAVRAWLRGRGTMIVGNEPEYCYTVDLGAQCQFDKLIRGIWGGTLQMHTQPFKTAAIQPPPVTLTASGATVYNPGDVDAEPLITLNGTGDVTLTVGGETLEITGISSGWQIDSALKWVMDAQGAPQWNAAAGEWGELPAGNSVVAWTGDITSVTITPRWRYL